MKKIRQNQVDDIRARFLVAAKEQQAPAPAFRRKLNGFPMKVLLFQVALVLGAVIILILMDFQ